MRDYEKNGEHLEEMLAFATLDQVYPLAEALIDHHHRTSCFKKNNMMFDNDYSSSEYRWKKALYCVYTWLGQKGFPIEELSFKRIIMEHMLLQGGYFEALSKDQLDELFSNNEDIDILADKAYKMIAENGLKPMSDALIRKHLKWKYEIEDILKS